MSRRLRASVPGFIVTPQAVTKRHKMRTRARNRRDIPPGPGILSGDEGEFVIYRVKRTPPAKKASSNEEEGEASDTNAQ